MFRKSKNLSYRILCGFIAFSFIFTLVLPPQVAAQVMPASVLNLPIPGSMVTMSSGFIPPLVKGITIHPENPLMFDFIVDSGESMLEGDELRAEADKMIKYFLASLTVPEDEMWVNLSPYEKDRIIPDTFGLTMMGRDLLAQDYLLKQLTASLMYPEDELGNKFWKRVYDKAYAMYGTTEIPMNTFNKIWIVPETAVVFEKGNSAYVVESHLKVMLEEDYLALQENIGSEKFSTHVMEETDVEVISGVTSAVVKEVLIPEIEKEVNQGETFANLRQIYNSMILATWFKSNLKESLLGQVYVDQNKTKGVDVEDSQVKQKIYEQYLEAFKKGVYNYIKEDVDPVTNQMIPRKYFSGGFEAGNLTRITQAIRDEYRIPAGALEPAGSMQVYQTLLVENAQEEDQGRGIQTVEKEIRLASSPVQSENWSPEYIFAKGNQFFADNNFSWAEAFIQYYNERKGRRDFREQAKRALAMMLFDENLHYGTGYILQGIESIPPMPITPWGQDKSVNQVLLWYGFGKKEKSQEAVERIIGFYQSLSGQEEQRLWFIGQIVNILAFEDESSVPYERAVRVWKQIGNTFSQQHIDFWKTIIRESGLSNKIGVVLEEFKDERRAVRRKENLVLKASYDKTATNKSFRERLGIMQSAIVIEDLNGWVNNLQEGRFKTNIEADFLIHENVVLGAAVKWRKKGDQDWTQAPMYELGNYRWAGNFEIDSKPENYEFTLEAWVNVVETWRQDINKRVKTNPMETADIRSDILKGIKLLNEIISRHGLSGAELERVNNYIRQFEEANASIDREDLSDNQRGTYAQQVDRVINSDAFINLVYQYLVKDHDVQYDELGYDIAIKMGAGLVENVELSWIQNIAPVIDNGRFVTKSIVNEPINISADILVIGEEEVYLKFRKKDSGEDWKWVEMLSVDEDGVRKEASFTPNEVGRYEYSFEVVKGGEIYIYEEEATPFQVMVNREEARFGTWYELFPRSFGGFKEGAQYLSRVGKNGMGFNILYLPPVHPIGRTKRKGRNNSLVAEPGDPGSPWAIGDALAVDEYGIEGDGGHRSIDPNLGSFADFEAYLAEAKNQGMEVSLDLTIQTSPDHPYVKNHPEWFSKNPDGSIKFAENPPKKYEDVYPINFYPESDEDMEALWNELKGVVEFWIDKGVTNFRVDNPHKKPFRFWEWLIDEIHQEHPEVLFLAEAFTDPKTMRLLAKVGFQLSYTYYPWKNTKNDLIRYVVSNDEGIVTDETQNYLRGVAYMNTPDILPDFLKDADATLFKMRYVLATMLPQLGVYGPEFELTVNKQAGGSSTDYQDSEKYELIDWPAILAGKKKINGSSGDISDFITKVNQIRKDHRALQLDNIQFLDFQGVDLDSMARDHILSFIKKTPDNKDVVLVSVNLDPEKNMHWVRGALPLSELGIGNDEEYILEDLLNGISFRKRGPVINIGLDSSETKRPLAHIFSVKKFAPIAEGGQAASSPVTGELKEGLTINRLVNNLLDKGSFRESAELRAELANDGIGQVHVDEKAEEIISEVGDRIIGELKTIADGVSLGIPGEMHYKVFNSDAITTSGLYTYLATQENGKKILMISADEKFIKIFKGLDYEVAIITTEMGFDISGYGGIGTYMTTLMPYLSEYFKIIEIGWDDNGEGLKGEEKSYGDVLGREDQQQLKFFGVKKEGVKGYETVRQAYELSEQMVDFLAENHPEILLAYIQVWYNAGAVPQLDQRMRDVAKTVIFHSVQPSKHWKAGALGGVDGQMMANIFESNYASDSIDGIIEMTRGNGAEALQFYEEGEVRINRDHYAWLAGDDTEALYADLVEKGYVKDEGKVGLLTEAFDQVLNEYELWYGQLAEVMQSNGYMDENQLLTVKTEEDREGFDRLVSEFEQNNPRTRLSLSEHLMQYEEGVLKLVRYKRVKNLKDKLRTIYHGIPGEAKDIPLVDRDNSFQVLNKYLERNAESNPGKVEGLKEKLQEAKDGERKVFTYVGRLSGQKGLKILIDSLEFLDPEKYLLVLVAGSPDSDEMQQLADRDIPEHSNILWINEHVKDQNDVDAIRTGSDVILVPSTNEPFGLVILEAWRAYKPVVALRESGGPEELIKDIREHDLSQANGILADQQTPESLARAIDQLLALSNEEMKELQESAFRDFKANYDLRTNTAPRTYKFFEDMIANKQELRFERKKEELAQQGRTGSIAVISDEFAEEFGTFMQATLLAQDVESIDIIGSQAQEGSEIAVEGITRLPETGEAVTQENILNLTNWLLDRNRLPFYLGRGDVSIINQILEGGIESYEVVSRDQRIINLNWLSFDGSDMTDWSVATDQELMVKMIADLYEINQPFTERWVQSLLVRMERDEGLPDDFGSSPIVAEGQTPKIMLAALNVIKKHLEESGLDRVDGQPVINLWLDNVVEGIDTDLLRSAAAVFVERFNDQFGLVNVAPDNGRYFRVRIEGKEGVLSNLTDQADLRLLKREILKEVNILEGIYKSIAWKDATGQTERVGSPIREVAESVSIERGETVGGIDLNPALLDLQIRRDGNGVPLPILQQPIRSMDIEGFLPVIINVTPVTSLPLLLGLSDTGSVDLVRTIDPDLFEKRNARFEFEELEV